MDLLGSRRAVLLRHVCTIVPLQGAGWVGFFQFYFVVVFFSLLTLPLVLLDLPHPCCYWINSHLLARCAVQSNAVFSCTALSVTGQLSSLLFPCSAPSPVVEKRKWARIWFV